MCEDVRYTKKELRNILDTRMQVFDKDNFILMDVTFLALYSLVMFCKFKDSLDFGEIKLLIKPNLKK